jgi:hypothetical protein
MEKSDKDTETPPFIRDFHDIYLKNLDKTVDSDAIGHYTNEHLKISGGYWCIGA